MAALLSQNKFISELGATPISSSSFFNQSSSHIPLTIPRNSASALDNATTFCFLLLHVTRLPPTKVKYPEVDFLSVMFPARSASV